MPLLVLILFVLAEALLKNYLYTPPFGFSYSHFHAGSFIVLAGSLGYFLVYFQKKPQKDQLWQSLTAPSPPPRWNLWIVLALIVLGSMFRLWKLGTLLDGMTYDEAYKGLDAIAIRELGERPIFLDWNGGREALVAYLVAVSQLLFDYSIVSVRMISALAGCLSLVFLYLFAKTIFNYRMALLATFLLAVSKWHIIHSRYGVRAGQYVVFELAVLYFLARGFTSTRRRARYFLLAGIIGGLGFYTYIAYRIFPAVIIAFLLEKTIRTNFQKNLKPALAGALICMAILAPLAAFYIRNLDSFRDRMQRTAVWNTRSEISPARLVFTSAVDTFGMFTHEGDSIARHNVDKEPMLSPFSTSFFILGLLLLLINFRKPYALFLIFYFLLTLVPGILSVMAPNVPRVFGCLPPTMLLTSFGILAAMQILRGYSRTLMNISLIIILSGSFYTGINDALVRYPSILDSLNVETSEIWGMDRDPEDVADLLNQLGTRCEAYLSPQFFFHSTIEYLTYTKSTHKLFSLKTDLRRMRSGKIAVVVLQPNVMNTWWIRDDDGKQFFKWWNQRYGLDIQGIRRINKAMYEPPKARNSDEKLMDLLAEEYPSGKPVRFPRFSIYLVKMPR